MYANVEPQVISGVAIGRISPAFTWFGNHGVFHELELTRVDYRNKPSYSSQTLPHFHLALRYELGYALRHNRNQIVKPVVGLAMNPSTSHFWWKGGASREAGRSSWYENSIAVVPRLLLSLGKRYFVDVNVALPVLIWQHNSSFDHSSAYMPSWLGMISGFFDEHTVLRLGAGVRL